MPAEDVENPTRTIPRATVLGTALTAVVYILGTVAVLGILPAATLAESGAPFADAADTAFGTWAGPIIAAAAVVSAFGCLNGWILLQGQVPMAAARDDLFPKFFSKTTRSGAPVVGLVVSSVFITGLTVMTPAGPTRIGVDARRKQVAAPRQCEPGTHDPVEVVWPRRTKIHPGACALDPRRSGRSHPQPRSGRIDG